PRWIAVCALLAAAAAGLAQFNQPWPRRAQAEPAAALHGEAAVRRLKTSGGYASLAAALAAARYQINAAPAKSTQSGAPFYANNPGQRLRTTFASDEVRVSAASNQTSGKTDGKTDGAELCLQLAGYGYGEQLEPLAAGKLTANGNRIAIAKSAIHNPQSAITEWYVNKPEGLEQGFTLAAPPTPRQAGEWLRVALSIGDGWRVSLRGDGQGALFERQADGLRLGYDHLLASDAQGRTLPARMELDGGALALLVDDAQAVYPLTIDPILTQQQKLTAVDAAALDQFGAAVALSGDTAVIGAPLDDLKGVGNQGSVYVFTRSGTSWSLQQKLTASDGVAGDGFGSAVAVSGDTVVVGVFADDIGANADQGSAYVFTRSGAVWTQQQKLTASDGAASHHFGFSVALSGDTVVVGAQGDDIGANANQGSAYVFTRGGVVWTLQQKLTANDGATGDNFGFSAALSGDTVVVGAPLDDTGRNVNHGSAYIFTRIGVTWTQQQKLLAAAGATGDQFGRSVAVSGDTAVVGAPFDDVGGNTDQGSAYIFTRNGTVWTQQQKLTTVGINSSPGDNFGVSVAFNGRTVVVGALGVDNKQGSVHVFTNDGAIWTEKEELRAGDGAANDQLGRSVALSGDTVLAGAPNNSGAFAGQGAAYVFVICAGNLEQQQQLTANDGAAFDRFGASVALNGDTVVVGDDTGPIADHGAAYVFTRSGTVWTLQQKLTAGDGAFGDDFGASVAISGDTVVVGAHLVDIGANFDQGAAYVFTRSGTLWTQQQKLTSNDGAFNDFFGASVALSGDTVVVGARGKDIGTNLDQGAAYVFTRGGGFWTQQQKLTEDFGAASDFFGISVAISGQTVVVGAESGNANKGAAYVFTSNGTFWTQQQKLIANDGAAGDFFGLSVAISGDTVVVGAPGGAIGANSQQGSAYVFTRFGTVWTLQQKLTAGDGAFGDDFGASVAISGDTVVVGALADDISANTNQGSAYVFTRSGGFWTQQQKLTANDGAANDIFGVTVALSGDTVVVGAEFDAIGANVERGSAYVFACR
ncbi:MAG: FG-GAP repeat protein, partial [Blastocatellia bacterium]